jgi:hypothetical protein
MDVLGGLLLATSFNLFFFVAGAAAFMTLVHRREANRVWSLLLHKFGSRCSLSLSLSPV